VIPVKDFITAAGVAIGADTSWLAQPTTFVAVALIKLPFTPSPARVLGDLTLADFTGSTPLHAASAATQVTSDPFSGSVVLQVREPAGGWHWVTGDAVNLPQTIYGYALLSSDLATLIATAALNTPIPLTGAGQGIDIGQVRVVLAQGGFS